jgi:hypothetical protein
LPAQEDPTKLCPNAGEAAMSVEGVRRNARLTDMRDTGVLDHRGTT